VFNIHCGIRNFDDAAGEAEVGREEFVTWLALLRARPSSGHIDLMDKLHNDKLRNYVKVSTTVQCRYTCISPQIYCHPTLQRLLYVTPLV